MSVNSKIEWTDATWNPVTGCTKISPGCSNCYAETFAERFRGVSGHPYEQGFDLRLWETRLELPLSWKKPKRIFVNSMSDLFHQDIPEEFIHRVFRTMNAADWHTFQILTKRIERVLELDENLAWKQNIWLGVSIESQDYAYRSNLLSRTGAAIKFLSIEPLIGRIETLSLDEIDWVIAGGESGRKARFMDEEWVLEIRDACVANEVAFFFKQWGGKNKKDTGRMLQGRTWDQMPGVAECY